MNIRFVEFPFRRVLLGRAGSVEEHGVFVKRPQKRSLEPGCGEDQRGDKRCHSDKLISKHEDLKRPAQKPRTLQPQWRSYRCTQYAGGLSQSGSSQEGIMKKFYSYYMEKAWYFHNKDENKLGQTWQVRPSS